jgi:hypothetical protein
MTSKVEKHIGQYSTTQFHVQNQHGALVPVRICQFKTCGFEESAHNDLTTHTNIINVKESRFAYFILNTAQFKSKLSSYSKARRNIISKLKSIKEERPHAEPHQIFHELLDYILDHFSIS